MKRSTKKLIMIILVVIVIIVLATTNLEYSIFNSQKNGQEIITIVSLKKIIDTSELNTFQAVYNGIAEVENKDNSDTIDFYVSYEAKVNAGFDFERIEIAKDEELKRIIITIPEIKITDVNVDITSLDYMFQNKKADASTVSERAYKASIEDVTRESKKKSDIYKLAEQNAKNIIEALTNPFIDQFDSEYVLEIKQGGK